LSRCVDELLKRGLDDWIQAAEVAGIVKSVGSVATEREIRDLALDLIRDVIERGLMKIGEVSEKEGFVEWKVPIPEAVERVRGAWDALDGMPDLGEVCWLANSDRGDRNALNTGFLKYWTSRSAPEIGKAAADLAELKSKEERRLSDPSRYVGSYDRLPGRQELGYSLHWVESLQLRDDQLEILAELEGSDGEQAADEKFRHYLLDTGRILKGRALSAREERDRSSKPGRHDFRAGRLLAYYEVVGVLLSQAEAFGIPAEDLRLDEIDCDRDLT
jgi:hypothetical protein